MILYWNQQKFKRTIKFSSNNAFVSIMRSAPGFTKSHKFLNHCAPAFPNSPVCFPSRLYNAFQTSAGGTSNDAPSIINDDNLADDDDEAYH